MLIDAHPEPNPVKAARQMFDAEVRAEAVRMADRLHSSQPAPV